MEEKGDVTENLLCSGCLCIGKTLRDVTDHRMQRFYMDALMEIPLYSMHSIYSMVSCPALCFECTATLKKAVHFREQVKDSFRILQTYTKENLNECLISEVSRPSRLILHTNPFISITPIDDLTDCVSQDIHVSDTHESDTHDIHVSDIQDGHIAVQRVFVKEDEVKSEWDLDKLENSIDDRCPSPLTEDFQITEKAVKKTIGKNKKKKRKSSTKTKVKNGKKIVKRLKTDKKPSIKLKSKQNEPKIRTIELSYEEMLLEREKESKRDSYSKATYKCESCCIGFSYSKSYKAHVEGKHNPAIGDYSCPICKTVIASVESFTSHYKRHLRRYECSICAKRTMDMKAMQQHYYSSHNIALRRYTCKCHICGKVSESVDKHRYHLDTHKARIQCPECDKSFTHRAGLMNHRLSVHEYNNDFPCPMCDKVFRWKTSLKRHLEKHQTKADEEEPAAKCTLCEVSFMSQSSYQRHLRNSLRHVTPSQLRFICDDCGRRFADKTKLRDHIEEIHLHKTYHCHICQKPSKNRVGLDQHIRNVHKGRPNDKMCHHCGKGFPTKVQLESHIRTHTGERPFICELCPTTFSQQSNLYKHNRTVHLNIKSKRYPVKKRPDRDQTCIPQQTGEAAELCNKPHVLQKQDSRLFYKFVEN